MSPRLTATSLAARFPSRAVAVVALAATGCGSRDRAGSGESGPLLLDAADVRILGTSESLANVQDLEVLPDGSVWVLNSVAPYFIGFDAGGEVVGVYGEAGGGPEEYGLPSAFVTGGIDGSAWVFDLRRHVLVEVPGPAGARSEIAIPHASVPPGTLRGGMDVMSTVVRTAALADEVLLPRSSVSIEDGVQAYRLGLLGADLVALDRATLTVRDVVALGEVLSDPAEGFQRTQGGFPLWYRLWAVCGDEIRVYDRGSNEMRGFTATGLEREPIPLPPPPFTEATPREFVRAFFDIMAAERAGVVGARPTAEDSIRVMNEALQRVDGEPRELAAYLPRYVDFRCSGDGTLWLRPFDLDVGGGGLVWLRITADEGVREVHLPPRFDPYRFTTERIWGVQRDPLDVASVAWIELPEL